MGNNNGKTVSDADRARVKKAYQTALKLQGGAGGRTISDLDVKNILKKSPTPVGVSANIKRILEKVGLSVSQMKKLREQLKDKKYFVKSKEAQAKEGTNKKGKPHLKKGGKAKKMKA